MTIFRSLRSRLIVASLLWTSGLLALMHMVALVTMHVFPATRKFGIIGPLLGGLILMAAGLYGLRSGLMGLPRDQIEVAHHGGPVCGREEVVAHREALRIVPQRCDGIAIVVTHG